jgi:hypothetical protein
MAQVSNRSGIWLFFSFQYYRTTCVTFSHLSGLFLVLSLEEKNANQRKRGTEVNINYPINYYFTREVIKNIQVFVFHNRLRKGVNILVATPGRLVDHLKVLCCKCNNFMSFGMHIR